MNHDRMLEPTPTQLRWPRRMAVRLVARDRSNEMRRPSRTGRRGSVLVVVLALLSALMLLGFMFYTLASQERENARYFAASEKFYSVALSPDELMNYALEQVIVGPEDRYANSALWGGRYSLLASLTGANLTPFNGQGVNLISTGVGVPRVDQNYDGTADTLVDNDSNGVHDFLQLDMAGWAAATSAINLNAFPAPDVGYSYPDINSVFLSYVGTEPVTGNTIVIPSFHRPQYLRGLFGKGTSGDWYTDPLALSMVMRPHQERKLRQYNSTTGTVSNVVDTATTKPVPRFDPAFFGDTTASASGDPKTLKEGFWGATAYTDATVTDLRFDVDADNDSSNGAEAVWLDLDYPVDETPDGLTKFIPMFAMTIYDLDGLLNLNAHGNLYGDVDLAGNPFGSLDGTTGLAYAVSRSNSGRSRAEVNPIYGLDAPPTLAAGAEYSKQFGHSPASSREVANMDFWFMLMGRADRDTLTGSVTDLFTGRWGEVNILEIALNAVSTNPADYPRAGVTGSDVEPTGADGDRGLAYQDLNQVLFPRQLTSSTPLIFPMPVHPEDHRGQSTAVDVNGKTPLLAQLIYGTTTTRLVLPRYSNAWLPPVSGANYLGPAWFYLQQIFSYTNQLVQLASFGLRDPSGRLIDDPGETLLDFELARDQSSDSIFGPDETAYLHMSKSDRSANSISSRLIDQLALANFNAGGSTAGTELANAAARRKRFTTQSTDLKSYTLTSQRMRNGETDPATGSFPYDPVHASNPSKYVFREEVRQLLGASPNSLRTKGLLRKLSTNHVAAGYFSPYDGRMRYLLRPLTPHPTGLGSTALATTLAGSVPTQFGLPDNHGAMLPNPTQPLDPTNVTTNTINTAARQEWFARRDRQNLARDIYTLLYTLGHPNLANTLGTPNTPVGTVYSYAQCREMAQFAVNMVDAMDADDNVTVFVYDLDLSNGFTSNDNGYVNPVTGTDADTAVDLDLDGIPGNDIIDVTTIDGPRAMVFGVEAQQLAFSEALVVLAKKFTESGSDKDFAATDWDDKKHRDFTYVELQNVTPTNIASFEGGWSIVCEPSTSTGVGLPFTGRQRAMTLFDPTISLGPGKNLTIAAAGDAHNQGRMHNPANPYTAPTWPPSGNVDSLLFTATTDADKTMAPMSYVQIVPNLIAPSDPAPTVFDLLARDQTNATTFRINEINTTVERDGTSVTTDPDSDTAITNGPKSGGWLDLGTQGQRDGVLNGTVKFTLRRRANVHRAAPAQTGLPADQPLQNDNPWIVVDSISVPLRVFDLTGVSAAPAFLTKLTNDIRSSERNELLRDVDAAVAPDTVTYKSNHIGSREVTTTAMTLWQRHYDRSFASPADLLTVPLYSPRTLTRALASSVAVRDPRQTAAVNFLFPDVDFRPTLPVAPAPQIDVAKIWPNGNLWYRGSRPATRGVPRLRRATSRAPSGSIRTPSSPAPRVTTSSNSSSL